MFYAAFLIILFTSFTILAWRNFHLSLVLFCGLLPTYLLRFSLGPLPTTALEIFTLILFSVWLLKKQWTSLPKLSFGRKPTSQLSWPALILILITLILATLHAPNIFTALGILKAYYLEPAIILILTLSTFKKTTDWTSAFIALAASAVVVALIGFAQYFTGLGFPLAWLAEHRVTSVFDFPNAVGLFLAPILSMLLVFLFSLPKLSFGRKQKIELSSTLIISIILISGAIILAQTEAAFLAIPAALFLTLLLSKVSRTTKFVSTALVLLALIGALTIPTIRTKILLHDVSGTARTQMWHETLSMLRDHPLLGAGLSSFPTVIAPYHDASYFEIFQYPHNIFLNIWVELGLPGLLAFLIISFFILKTLLPTKAQLWSQTQNRAELGRLMLLAAFFTIIIHGLVDVPFFKNDLAMLTALLLSATVYLNSQQTKVLPLAK